LRPVLPGRHIQAIAAKAKTAPANAGAAFPRFEFRSA
jgi:hypothetical protein